MRARIAVRSLLVAALLIPALAPPPAHAQTPSLDTASAAAYELSVLETDANWDALYDRLHPDSQLTVSRNTLAYWYQTYFAVNGPNPATITSATLTDWTWPVTGRTYPNTAEIAYAQPFDNGVTITDVVRLVPAEDGTWRWFFGRSPQFIQQITQESGANIQPPPIPDRTGIQPNALFAEAIAAIAQVEPACFIAAGITALPTQIGFDSISSNQSESGARTESASFMPPSGIEFPDLIANALTLQNGETPESVARKIDASRQHWDGPPYTAPPRGFVADLAPGSPYLITYYEEYNEATGYLPVLTWGPHASNTLFTVVGPAAGLINGLVAEWSENARATCVS